MPEADFRRLQKYQVQPDDLLVSVVGTLGNVAIVTPNISKAIFSCKSTVYRSLGAVDPYYLAAYLNAEIGQAYLERNSRGAIQMGLNLDDLANIPIYIPTTETQQAIGALVKQAYTEQQKSKDFYHQAEQLLLNELDLSDLDLSDDLYGEAKLTEVWTANRLDAEYSQPKYERIRQHIRSLSKYATLGDLGIVTNGSSPGEYVNSGIPVIRAINLRDLDSESNWLHISPKDIKSYLKQGDVLVSAIGFGSIGKVGVVEEDDKYTTVPEVIFVRTNKLDSFVLQTYLSSEIGQAQLEQWITGSTGQLHLFPWQVAKILVPIPDSKLQREIANLHIQARSAKRHSKELLAQAKQKVEALIESEAANG